MARTTARSLEQRLEDVEELVSQIIDVMIRSSEIPINRLSKVTQTKTNKGAKRRYMRDYMRRQRAEKPIV